MNPLNEAQLNLPCNKLRTGLNRQLLQMLTFEKQIVNSLAISHQNDAEYLTRFLKLTASFQISPILLLSAVFSLWLIALG